MMTHSTRCARSGQGRTAVAFVLILFGVAGTTGAQVVKPAPPRPGTTKPKPIQQTERVYISVNGAFQSAGESFGETVTFVENAENGTFSTSYEVKSGPALNISGGANIWRNVGVGIGITRYSKATPTAFTASVPHPFFFNRARSVSADLTDLTREELAVHVQARATFVPTKSILAVVFAGPSFFTVKQGIVSDFEITESYPYDAATFSQGVTTAVDESKVGFHIGADVGFFFTRQVGVGGTVQWSGTTIDVPASGGSGTTLSIKVGGVQFGGGLRLRF